MISAELMYEKVMHRMDMTKETKEEELQEIIRTVLEDESKKEFIPLSEKIRLSRENNFFECNVGFYPKRRKDYYDRR